MWTEQTVTEAKDLLLSAAQVERVTTGEISYIVADETSYIDEIYEHALNELVRQKRLKLKATAGDRTIYQRVAS